MQKRIRVTIMSLLLAASFLPGVAGGADAQPAKHHKLHHKSAHKPAPKGPVTIGNWVASDPNYCTRGIYKYRRPCSVHFLGSPYDDTLEPLGGDWPNVR